ncbi:MULTISPECIES: DUF2273 domain-containing protein [Microbacterium]|jgi:uncharacterized membrane protein|uniref:DUF2273 domain-containing protein n=1 Tax=Microbacterium TaxID=33882 RepID=UPI00217E62A4|nr:MULTISPECIES: DUF2273 domain-containing protein [Microbacterium]UWF76823.1 DUF2273 domain-containing protein [Microbacterium neungamense]WCM54975.1 DUF2273 domain-containing protein [Microbacterium sp. EF45047]
MSTTLTGALVGAVLAFAALTFGFWGFLLVALLMGIGALAGRVVSGQLDLRALAGVFTGRRVSS